MDPDIMLTGICADGSYIAALYENLGGLEFRELHGAGFEGVRSGATAWGDYDSDGDLDLLLTGLDNSKSRITKIYRNDSHGVFTDIYAFIRGVADASVGWGDYDSDGDLDILLAGLSGSKIALVYSNEGNGDFIEKHLGLFGASHGEIAWGDYNNDRNLDIFITGLKDAQGYARLFKSNINNPVMRPPKLEMLQSGRFQNGTMLKWNQARESGLSYNIRVGSKSQGIDIISPMSNSGSGDLAIPKMGNCELNASYFLSPKEGTYYWSVQSIDNAFVGSEWADEQTFTVAPHVSWFTFDTVCSGTVAQFTDESSSASVDISNWFWDFGDGYSSVEQSPNHQYILPGIYSVKLRTSSNDHIDSISRYVLVVATPQPDFEAEIVSLGAHTPFENTSIVEDAGTIQWYWDFGDGESYNGEDPQYHKYDQVGEYEVQLMAVSDNGCSAEVTKSVLVCNETMPKPVIYGEGPNVIYLACSNDSATFYRWYRNDELINGANEYLYLPTNNRGVYRVEISNSGTCYVPSEDYDLSQITGLSPADPWENLKIYPNPTPGLFTLEMDNAIMGELVIDIFKGSGARIINIKFHKETAHFLTQIDLSDQPGGVYMVGLMLGEFKANRRLVVE